MRIIKEIVCCWQQCVDSNESYCNLKRKAKKEKKKEIKRKVLEINLLGTRLIWGAKRVGIKIYRKSNIEGSGVTSKVYNFFQRKILNLIPTAKTVNFYDLLLTQVMQLLETWFQLILHIEFLWFNGNIKKMISSSSSSSRSDSTDSPPLSPSVLVIHRSRQVFQTTSCDRTELI